MDQFVYLDVLSWISAADTFSKSVIHHVISIMFGDYIWRSGWESDKKIEV